MSTPVNIAGLRQHAQRRLPRMFFDYIDGGAFSEATLRCNEVDFDALALRPQILRDVSRRDLSVSVLGQKQSLPLILGPVGFAGMFWKEGEVAANRAAAAAGIPFCLSTMSICPVKRVSASAERPVWFQSYILRDRGLSKALLDRAAACGVTVVVVTVDTAVSGLREKDVANGFRLASRLGPRAMLDLARHPSWCWQIAGRGMPLLGNFPAETGATLMSQSQRITANIDPALTWADLAELRTNWPGKLIVKGIMTADDAERALDVGADAIVVSNHGGRQLDGAPSTISVLRRIVERVAGRAEVLLDGGIRRGSQVVKALALGADAVLLGRAYAFGLAAEGEAGVSRAIEMIATEIDITLALMGFNSVAELRAAGLDAFEKTEGRP
ncbi:hypothetical protein X743_30150 [Mesorhizobium sp. LNHC252B00]|uniref:alpha-hydroxy acid oxidase n=1 Tax=Mesorhizobium sp. LNHC252B00 TaxID=1287252 RepID=UPI0003CEA2B2|nr:alpha-hydroxy acid oxidase [Mesorhizobium sp. LNHC252B00]ESY64923.1 hypothetical protein X743_30150 [Mesorhizobium sp. LNHC252B00]